MPSSPDLGRKAKLILSLLCLKFSARGVYMLDQEEEEVGEEEDGEGEEEGKEEARAATLQQKITREGRRSCLPGVQ